MEALEQLKNEILDGKLISKEEAMSLLEAPLDALCAAADELRKELCGNSFDICTIVNGKCGRCSEDCKYCAQSAHYNAHVESYPLLNTEELMAHAKYNADRGVLRYSIVTSGKRLSDAEVEQVCDSIRTIKKQVDIEICVSFGLLSPENFRKVKEAGASRVHCNLEAARDFFPTICTTHTYDDKIKVLTAAKEAGLGICSGGIMGLGESMEDRIDMALDLRALGVRSVPVNFLNPIPGTPLAHQKALSFDEKRRIIAIYRFINPTASIRLAGGRGLMEDKGEACFTAGANAAISGDMLTTAGYTIETDMKLIDKLGFRVALQNM